MKTTLLVGSGVSYISGMPKIWEITEFIKAFKDIHRHSDSNFYIKNYLGFIPPDICDCEGYLDNQKYLLNKVADFIKQFYELTEWEHEVNYEDIYYVLSQIEYSFRPEFENPAVFNLIQDLLKDNTLNKKSLIETTTETIKMIQCVVWQMIDKEIKNFNQYSILPNLISHFGLEHIVSLNHDLVLESYLEENRIQFFDGFEQSNSKINKWTGFDKFNSNNLKLYKLHGSVNWFDFHVFEGNGFEQLMKIPKNTWITGIEEINGQSIVSTDGSPKLLIGTFNKMLGYLTDVFSILYEEFKKSLLETDVLIISGYGFGDKGVNTQIVNWLNQPISKKLIIIHPKRKDLVKNARGNIYFNVISETRKNDKVELIEKCFEDVTIEDVQNLLK